MRYSFIFMLSLISILGCHQHTSKEYIEKGNAKVALNDYEGAIADYSKALEIDPKNAVAYSNRGDSKAKIKDTTGAIADYNKTMDIIDTPPPPAFKPPPPIIDADAVQSKNNPLAIDANVGTIYWRAYSSKAALEDPMTALNKTIMDNPNDIDAYNKRAILKADNRKDYQSAMADYNKAIEIAPKNAALYCNRSILKEHLMDYRGAIADCNKAIDIDPKYAGAYSERGYSKANIKDDLGAIADYNKTIELNPKDGNTYANRGLAKIALGQKDNGCLDLSKAGELGCEKAYDYIKEYCK